MAMARSDTACSLPAVGNAYRFALHSAGTAGLVLPRRHSCRAVVLYLVGVDALPRRRFHLRRFRVARLGVSGRRGDRYVWTSRHGRLDCQGPGDHESNVALAAGRGVTGGKRGAASGYLHLRRGVRTT
jgi:hypothetical protein